MATVVPVGHGADVNFAPTKSTSSSSGSFSQSGGSRNLFWKPSKLLARDVMAFGREQFKTPLQYYPGSTVVPTSPALSQGIEQLQAQAAAGSPINAQAQQLGTATLRGDFLTPDSNPYLQSYYNSAARDVTSQYQNSVLPDLGTRFNAAGRGGGAYQNALGQAQLGLGTSLGDLANQIYAGAYESERGRQQQTLGLSPVLQQMGYEDTNQLLRAGALQQDEGQRLLDAQIARQRFNQMEPWQRAGLASGLYGQAPVSSGTNFWQSGTNAEAAKQTQINPIIPQPSQNPGIGGFIMQLLGSIL